MIHSAVSPEQSRWARRLLGLSQQATSRQAKISVAYLKQFETGRFNPSEDFLEKLSAFFTSKDVDLTEFDDSHIVDPTPVQPGRPRKVRRMGCYVSDALSGDQVEHWFERIEENQERIKRLLRTKLNRGLFGDTSAESDEQLKDLYSRLMLEALMFRALFGNNPVEPEPLGDRKATVLGDHLADFFDANLGAPEVVDEPDDAEVAA